MQGRIHQQEDESALNTVGMVQAKRLADVATKYDVNALFTSPEIRAVDTANIIANILHIIPTISHNLRERDWGHWNGKPWIDIETKLNEKTADERYTFIPPEGESWQQMEHRLKQTLDSIVHAENSNIMIITHSGTLRALVPVLREEKRIASLQYDFANASVSLFSYSHDTGYQVKTINDITHLG